MSLRAAVYARLSVEKSVGADAKSVARQMTNARAFAASQGWTVHPDHVFSDDGVSGAEFSKRPGLQRLLTAATRRQFDRLIVSEQKSLGREMSETAYVIKRLAQSGVEVVEYVHGRSLTPRSAIEKLLSSVQGYSDEDHREKTRERVHEAHARLHAKGAVTGGRVYGYRNVDVLAGTDQHGRPLKSHVERQIVPAEAAVIVRMFTLYADGHGLKMIAKILTREGAPAPTPFVRKDPSKVGPVRGWAPGTIRAILSRDLYRGVLVWNKSRKRTDWGEKHQRPRPVDDWQTVAVPHLRIIPDDLWARVAGRRADVAGKTLRFATGRMSGRPPKAGATHLLAGLATCAVCGGGLVVETSARTGARVAEYVCYRRRANGGCTNDLRLPIADVDAAILTEIEKHVLTPAAVESVIALSEGDEVAERQALLARERQDVERRIARLIAALETGGEVASLTQRLRDLESRRTGLDHDLASLRPIPRLPARVLHDRLSEWRRLLRGSTTQARAVLQRVIQGRITFTPVDGSYHFHSPTRFDKLFSGLVIPRSVWNLPAGRGTERIRPEDVYGSDPVSDADYGALLERAYVKRGTSPTGFEPVFWP